MTLIEVLVVIGVLGVLLAVTVPALRGVRSAGRQVLCQSNLRQLGVTVESHLQTSSGAFPYAPPGAKIPTSPPDENGGSSFISAPHWNLKFTWPGLMHDTAPWREHFRSWICPGALRDAQDPWRAAEFGGPTLSSYFYSTSFIARPQVWMPGAVADDKLLKPARVPDVAHPSAKVVFYDSEIAHAEPHEGENDPARPMLFVDGHIALHRTGNAVEPMTNPFTGAAIRLHDTPRGAAGRDY